MVAWIHQSLEWEATGISSLSAVGDYSVSVSGLKPGHSYEFRAVAESGTCSSYGREMVLKER